MSNLNHLADKLEKKYRQKDEKRRKKMKVSGKRVFALKQIITEKGRKNT